MGFTLGQIVAGLPAKGGGRQNWGGQTDTSVGIIAAQQVVQELSESAELEELKYQTPIPPLTPLQLEVGNPIVPIAEILGTIATNTVYPQFQAIATQFVDITDAYDGWIWFVGGAQLQGAVNQSGRTIGYRRAPAVDMYTFGVTSTNQLSFGVAPPVYYTRFGANLQVGPSPDNPYAFFFRVKLRHPWPATNLAAAPIFAPDSWLQIFQYSAIRQLAADEGIQDTSIYKTATEFLEKRGMLPWQLRQLQMQRDEKHNERQASFRAAAYTFAR